VQNAISFCECRITKQCAVGRINYPEPIKLSCKKNTNSILSDYYIKLYDTLLGAVYFDSFEFDRIYSSTSKI
jgi:hypothetical protein